MNFTLVPLEMKFSVEMALEPRPTGTNMHVQV